MLTKKYLEMKKIFVFITLALELVSCSSLKTLSNTSGEEKQSAAALSSALESVDAKVPQYVSQIFSDSMTDRKIVENILLELKDPIAGYSGQLFDEWVNYSNSNASKKNAEYQTYAMKLSSAKGDLSKQISDAINQSLPKIFETEKKSFKTCRSSKSAGTCRVDFVNGMEKSISKVVEDKVKKYLKDRLDKL